MKLWELYPEVRNLYEEYNGILLEDDFAWKELTEKADVYKRQVQLRGRFAKHSRWYLNSLVLGFQMIL